MFQLNYQSHKSVYEQIVDNIKEQIITGALKENTQLPTVRELSQLLTINPHTVQKHFRHWTRKAISIQLRIKVLLYHQENM